MRSPPPPDKSAVQVSRKRVASVEDELSRRALDADVTNAYALLLGRTPESAAVMERQTHSTVQVLLTELLGAEEFYQRVLEPIIDVRPLTGALFDRPPAAATMNWAADLLPLSVSTRSTLRQQTGWYGLYKTIFADEAFLLALGDAQPQLLEPSVGISLSERFNALETRRIIGAVEEVSPGKVSGWALNADSPDEVLTLEAFVGDKFIGATVTGRFRRELQDLHGGQGRFGFELTGLPVYSDDTPLRGEVDVRDAVGGVLIGRAPLRFRRDQNLDLLRQLHEELSQVKAGVARIETAFNAVATRFGHTLTEYDAYRRIVYARTPLVQDAERQARHAFSHMPLISVLLVVDAVGVGDLQASLSSLAEQGYAHLEVLTAPIGLSSEQAVECGRAAERTLGDRARLIDEIERGASDARGDYLIFLRAGDQLSADAVQAVVAQLQGDASPVLLYSDEDGVLSAAGGRTYDKPRFKPDYDYDLQLQTGYIGDLLAVSRSALFTAVEAGGGLAPAERHDLVLRVLEATTPEHVVHIPRVLYHVGRPSTEETRDLTVLTTAADDHFQRTGLDARASSHSGEHHASVDGAVRIHRTRRFKGVKAAVIIPTRDRLDLIGPCVASLVALSAQNRVELEIIVVDNGGALEAGRAFLGALAGSSRIRVISDEAAFNWGALNNNAARLTDAQVLIFQNDDTVMLSRDGLDELCDQAMRPDVGVVGARLLFEDGTIQHAGVVLGGVNGVAYHEGLGAPGDDAGYLGRHALLHRTSAVTGACLATRSDVFRRLGGFDEHAFAVEAGDIDYCLRVQELGLAVLYDPFVTLYHFESKTRGQTGADPKKVERAERELDRLRQRWGERLTRDPWYNPHFDRFSRPFAKLGLPD